MLEGHGNNQYEFEGKIGEDFSSNIPYRNASALITEHLASRLHLIARYPDPLGRELTARLAELHAVSAGNLLLTNGSVEAFYLLAHLFSGKRSTVFYPSFAEYEDACRLYHHVISFKPVSELAGIRHIGSDLIWLGIPNNPDGSIIRNEELRRLCEENPTITFILDAAYAELCPLCESLTPLLASHPNLIIVYSLTKTFSIPGLRLGYIIAHETIINRLRSLCIPWSVNALAIEAGIFITENRNRLLPDAVSLCDESSRLQASLSALPQLEVASSPCHFFLVRMREGTAPELKSFLIEKYGVLIRDASNFRGLTDKYFRLSVQSETANRELIGGLQSYFVQKAACRTIKKSKMIPPDKP